MEESREKSEEEFEGHGRRPQNEALTKLRLLLLRFISNLN